MPCKLSRRITFAENDTENAMPKSIFDLPAVNKARQECIQMCEYVIQKMHQTDIKNKKEIAHA
jgi:hypothetical protein